MELTIEDYKNIANQIEEGEGCVEYIKGDECLTFAYDLQVDYYREYDTNALVEEGSYLYIEDVECTDEDGETDNNFDEGILQEMVA